MHDSAMEHGRVFFETYFRGRTGLKIADLGSQDVNGSLRQHCPLGNEYVGIDFVDGKGVDVIITDPYKLPFEDATFDAMVCSSCFEHSEFFWLTFNEAMRVLKPNGLLYLNVPANGAFHRYPVDCWRFYPDSGRALRNWARRAGMPVEMLESFTGAQQIAMTNDFVAVYVRDEAHAGEHKDRMLNHVTGATNAFLLGDDTIHSHEVAPEDTRQGVSGLALKRLRYLALRSIPARLGLRSS